ncbi:MAG: hypothetical protein J6N53_15010 [Lachnospiraceae bacterium]|nr:hypothetical protein [Lachnospiraceae bacterium]
MNKPKLCGIIETVIILFFRDTNTKEAAADEAAKKAEIEAAMRAANG